MKLLSKISTLISILVIGTALISCEKEEPQKNLPTLSITVSETTSNTIGMDVTATNGDKFYMHIIPSAETTLSVTDVIDAATQSITSSENEAEFYFQFENLTPDTDYDIYVVAENGDGHTMEKADAKTLEEGEEGVINLTHVLLSNYRSDNVEGNGNYELMLGTSTALEWAGDIRVGLSLYNEPDADPINAVLPNGTYNPDNTLAPFTYDPGKTYVEIVTEDLEVISAPIMGTVIVSREGAEYTIDIEGTLYGYELSFKGQYKGQLMFVETGTSAFEPFEEDQNVEFTDGQFRYWGNWFRPMADDCAIELFNGEFDQNGQFTGYHLTLINVYMPKYPNYNDPNIPIADGTYTVLPHREQAYYYSQEFTLDPGAIEPLFGELAFVGSRLEYIDGETGDKKVGIITEGSFTVTGNGDNTEITLNFKTTEGITITGSYNGEISSQNFNDSDEAMPQRPWSTLTEDVVYNFPEETMAYFFKFGKMATNDNDTWMVMVYGANQEYPDGYGDMFTTELNIQSSNGTSLPSGNYSINWSADSHTMFPGFIDYGNAILFTYYGDLTPDADGYSTHTAPIASGNVNISVIDENTVKFEFDMVDDSGNTITGEWSGAYIIEDLSGEIEQLHNISPLRIR